MFEGFLKGILGNLLQGTATLVLLAWALLAMFNESWDPPIFIHGVAYDTAPVAILAVVAAFFGGYLVYQSKQTVKRD